MNTIPQSLTRNILTPPPSHPLTVPASPHRNLVTFATLVTLATILASGCAAPHPLKGGHALTTPKPTGGLEQTLVQSENPAQSTKQDQQTIKVRTYTIPAGSRLESSVLSSTLYPPSSSSVLRAPAPSSILHPPSSSPPSSILYPPSSFPAHPASPPSSILYPPSSSFILSAPMPVTEREETRASTELGPAQKDTARELGAKLASLKGIVWVGLALFLFGLASLFYPPLRAIINSVTTSLALVLGGLALMVLPTLVVGHELLLLAGVSVVIAAWFLAHRHGQ
ncbi:MAG TPA: hypothetical protein VNT26_14090, partial [Candidatus Sulfotelmatobacter sp.]|nr:hypothetical protein [Candidatus Sulfotelmatobacter sp.]